MHRLLLINEVLSHIFKEVQDFGDDKPLAAAARTCRVFHGPADEALWGSLANLTPIFRLLPSDAWTFQLKEGDIRIYELQRPLIPSDYYAIRDHAPSVKSLGDRCYMPSYRRDIVRSKDFRTMAMHCPYPVLFPSLRYMNWQQHISAGHHLTFPDGGNTWLDMCPCIGSALQELIIGSEHYLLRDSDTSETLLRVITKIKSESPSLSRLELPLIPSEALHRVSEHLSPLVCDLPNPKVLRCGNIPLTETALSHIAHLRDLCELELGISDNWTMQPIPTAMDSPLFDALHTLDIRVSDIQAYIDFASFIKLPRVGSFGIMFAIPPSQHAIQLLFASIHYQFSHTQLTRLRVSSEELDRSDVFSSNSTLRSEHLRPLLMFRGLKIVHIQADWMVDYDDEILPDMAEAWPDLTSLVLMPDHMYPYWDPSQSPASLKSLLAFSLRCPSLEYLAIHLHADGNEIPEWPPEISRVQHQRYMRLSSLEVGESTIFRPIEVAAFLSGVFPNLQSIYASEEEAQMRLWEEEVVNMVLVFHRVRNEERDSLR